MPVDADEQGQPDRWAIRIGPGDPVAAMLRQVQAVPGQEFAIDKFPTQADSDAAINHARTRGAWSIGVTEESDRAYLNQ